MKMHGSAVNRVPCIPLYVLFFSIDAQINYLRHKSQSTNTDIF